jgi:hypothetical protein
MNSVIVPDVDGRSGGRSRYRESLGRSAGREAEARSWVMFHKYDAKIYRTEPALHNASERWYVGDEDYAEAIRRGMQMRSEMAARIVRGLARKIASLF